MKNRYSSTDVKSGVTTREPETAAARRIGERRCADAVGTRSPAAGWRKALAYVLPVLIISTQQAVAQGNDIPNASNILTELMKVFLIAAVFEQAFAAIFNWRLYQEFFSARAVKTLVMLVIAALFVGLSGYDPVSKIIGFANGIQQVPATMPTTVLTTVLSALIIAGGSAGVNTLLVNLGLRTPSAAAEPPKPQTGSAWFSVRVVASRSAPRADYVVGLTLADQSVAGDPVLGVLARRSVGERLRRVFSRDPMRYPSSGGYTVPTGKPYAITLSQVVQDPPPTKGEKVIKTTLKPIWSWTGSFADRAIADFEITLERNAGVDLSAGG
ncbi:MULTISPECIES: hypothetical protein [Mesorhizobium]|uniref:Uncharacterized protein n=1 Tax=Rhizobium loti TaxID=381 RepID=A0A6M7UBG1_RHILI|nr:MULTISPECIES: hypothetical protein [Mesorhizobium]KRB32485.1 hypothetical protein ASE05_05720 [Mesorhizobium sp. Root172]OBQ71477.1 hypothetical protein A8145_00925 [Mesorhizobium loti]QKC72947.1 hypothetical protein EB815_30120 [Mesorhizobium loti]